MRIYINQTVKEDAEGLHRDHPDYEAWRDGAVTVWQVVTDAICLETGRKGQDATFGVPCPVNDTSYIQALKVEQIKTVLAEIGYDLDFD